MKPTLQCKATFAIEDYPEWTAYDAGYLVTKNAGWRSARPVVDNARCTGCLQCYLHCPDGVISFNSECGPCLSRRSEAEPIRNAERVYLGASQLKDKDKGKDKSKTSQSEHLDVSIINTTLADNRTNISIDYDFCKGCGICKKICKVGAIKIIDEAEANL